MDISIHDCDGVTIAHHMPGNANCVTLEISRRDAEPLRITAFGLPNVVTAQLIAALGRPVLVTDLPHVEGAVR